MRGVPRRRPRSMSRSAATSSGGKLRDDTEVSAAEAGTSSGRSSRMETSGGWRLSGGRTWRAGTTAGKKNRGEGDARPHPGKPRRQALTPVRLAQHTATLAVILSHGSGVESIRAACAARTFTHLHTTSFRCPDTTTRAAGASRAGRWQATRSAIVRALAAGREQRVAPAAHALRDGGIGGDGEREDGGGVELAEERGEIRAGHEGEHGGDPEGDGALAAVEAGFCDRARGAGVEHGEEDEQECPEAGGRRLTHRDGANRAVRRALIVDELDGAVLQDGDEEQDEEQQRGEHRRRDPRAELDLARHGRTPRG